MLYHKIEILLKASRHDTLELVENHDTELEQDFYNLLRAGYIEEKTAAFNCVPFRDGHGNLHTFKYIRITPTGIDLFKDLIKEAKKLKAQKARVSA